MCHLLKTTSCSFTFQITQSYDMNISIGITDKQDKYINGRGAIYFTGKSGKVFENGNEVGFNYITSL